jgi:hypothetical protein
VRTRPEARSEAPVAAPSQRAPAERPQPARPQPAQPKRAEGPVIGMGDHVPPFILRPVPNAELLPKLNDD